MNNTEKFLRERYDPVNNRTIYYAGDGRVAKVLSLIEPVESPVRALDIGCYDGEIALRIKGRLGGGCEMYGIIDVAENVAKLVESKEVNFKYNNLVDGIDFETDFFDFVFAGEIIEHIYDTDSFMEEIKRVLRPGGTLIITTPNMVSLGRRLFYLVGRGAFMEASLTFPPNAAGHIRFFTRRLLSDYLKANDFEIEAFTSDEVTIPPFKIKFLADIWPGLGHHLIFKVKSPCH